MTQYVILRLDDEGAGSWKEHGQAEASSPARAVRAIENGSGVYAAVPLRSWKPLTVRVSQKTIVTVT